jgi:predicted transcriptional regulator/sporulation protein YlmC with PRC-barrel domain
MIYLSDLLNKKVYFNRKVFGEMVDFAVQERTPNPSVSKVVIKRMGKKLTISPSFLAIKKNFAVLTDDKAPLLPFDEGDFYLNEDLMDKQVIDTNDKRLVRVNDIVFESEQELKVIGIDIGAAGLLRRLGIRRFINPPAKILPWQMIEAFDYQTGNIKINMTQHKLESMHPSELADILEDLGTKERLGVVGSLGAKKAARALENTDSKTQEAILEEMPSSVLEKVVAKMHVSEIADIFYKVNPLKIREMLKLIGSERAQKVEKLLNFGTDTAGGAMRTGFVSLDGDTTVKETFNALYKLSPKPEAIVVTNGNEKLVGVIYTKDILDSDSLAILKDIVTERKFVVPQTDFNQVISLFGRYNLRALPVVDNDKKPIGVITAGIVLSRIEERTQTNEVI